MSHYKPYPAYKDSGVEWIGEVPEHWGIAPVKTYYDIRLGKMLQPEQQANTDLLVPYHRAQTVQWECIDNLAMTTMWASPSDVAKFSVAIGDLLICEGGDVCRAAIVEDLHAHEVIFQNSLHRVRPKEAWGVEWILRLMQHLRSSAWIEVLCNKNTIVHFTSEKLGSLACPLPGPDEQCEITRALSRETARIDALIARKTRFIELLKEKRKALITHAVTKGLDPNVKMKDSGVEWIGEVPEHWEVWRLGSLYREAVRTGDPSLPILSISIHDGITDDELAPEDRDRQVYQIEDRTKYKRVRPNDLAYNMMRAWQGAFGAVAVDGLVSPAYVVAEPTGEIRSAYIENLLRTPMAVEEMRRFSRGIADFRMRLYWEYFRDLHVCVPSLDEQDNILAALSRRGARMERLGETTERSIALLKERRSALITAAVTGKIDLTSGDDA